MPPAAKRNPIILCLGVSGSGRTKFIDSVSSKDKAAVGFFKKMKVTIYQALRPDTTAVGAVTLTSKESPMILLDTPGVDLNDGVNDVKGDVQKWLKDNYKQEKIEDYVDFILYFHRITDNRVQAEPIPFDWRNTLDKFAARDPSRLIFVTTMCDKMRDEAKRQKVQDTLKTCYFQRWIEKGAGFEACDGTSEAASNVLRIISSALTI
ncbi:hypothetical protein CPB83DRAFT_902941 [Crepidotus variabilis]|uniref:G domain-containing protein n=1 Tax=Crepidotus variabilis TaxID=179855 RepID=A0A9P6ERL9_9AGAR|nr:hypothetical protein CPB83DRAFT_902941 [Crepidotus variabilis]